MATHVITDPATWPGSDGALGNVQLRDEKGQPGGYASLNVLGEVPDSQLPDLVGGTVGGDFGSFVLSTQAGPFAVHGVSDSSAEYDAASDTTFVAFYGTDYALMVMAFHHSNHEVEGPVRVCAPPSGSAEDAHGIPSIAIDDAGTLHVFFGPHDTPPRYAKTTSPRDIRAWSFTDLSVGLGTYHTLVWEPVTAALYATFRAAPSAAQHSLTYPSHEYGTMIRSLDHGATWTQLGDAGTPNWIRTSTYDGQVAHDFYAHGVHVDSLGQLHITWTIAAGASHDGPRHDVFHVIFRPSTMTFRTMDGTDLGSTIDTQSELLACRAATAVRCVSRMLITANDDPVFVYHETVTEDAIQRVAVKTARWDSGAWSTSDTGARSHYMFHYPTISELPNGDLVVFAVTGRPELTYVGHPLEETIVYTAIGGDVTAYRSTDGGATWGDDGMVIDGHKVRGSGISAIQHVRYAKHDLLAVACTSCQSFPPNNLSAMRLNLYGVGDQVNRDAVLEQDPGTTEQLFDPQVFVTQAAAPAESTWTTLNLRGRIPQNVTAVRLRASLRGGGAGSVRVALRIKGTTNATGIVEFAMRGDWTDDNVFEAWCPITPHLQQPSASGGQLEWQWSGAGTLAQAGWSLSGIRFH